jgi:glycosyltransferase involved in cell wall biosynthesis
MSSKRLISVVSGCYNEEENVAPLYEQVRKVFEALPQYDYEQIFIDNASTDGTVRKLKELAAKDTRVKVIVNFRNFGHIRSPVHAVFQARGDAIIAMASDLQDPPELIASFLQEWEKGSPIVAGVKTTSRETWTMSVIRSAYYRVIGRIADVKLIKNFTGFGLYDRSVIDSIRELQDPYPYFRGLISELGYDVAAVPYTPAQRVRGITKNNFYTLYDLAMLGITSHSKVPMRLATMAGFALSAVSLLLSIAYFIGKIFFWERFEFGQAPVLIGLFFFSSVQLFFIGLLGEYIGSIHTYVMKRPLVVERERVNFDEPLAAPVTETKADSGSTHHAVRSLEHRTGTG